jgi:hypothetical protein
MSSVFLSGGGVGHISAPLQISSSGKDVLACGTVITADNKHVEFRVAQLGVSLEFINDGTSPRLGQGTADGSTLRLQVYNFNNTIGSGTTAPLEIGSYAGRKLLFSFVVYAFNPDSTKTVHYTFMLGDPT